MSTQSHRYDPSDASDGSRGVGLRARLWVGCLLGAVVGGLGIWLVIFDQTAPGAEMDRTRLVWSLSGVAAIGFLTAMLATLWLDRGVVGQLRGLLRGMRSGRVTDLRGLPASGGWGELSALSEQIQVLIAYQRQALRTAEELGSLRRQMGRVQEAVESWALTDRLEAVEPEPGPLGALAQSFNLAALHLGEVRDQNREAASEVRSGIAHAHDEARAGSEQAERTFVEATALLTTVRELHRLGSELEAQLASGSEARGDAVAVESWRAACRDSIEDLVGTSAASVEHLARGLSAVQDIGEQVQVLSNRATLVALNVALVVTRSPQPPPEVAEISQEMKVLAREVRAASESMSSLAEQVNREVQEAVARTSGLRERVAERLVPPPPEPPGVRADVGPVLERLREMVQDAGQKGERLVSTAERTSRAAERALRALDDGLSELDGLRARLTQPAPAAEPATPSQPEEPVEPPGSVLRLVEPGEPPAVEGEQLPESGETQ